MQQSATYMPCQQQLKQELLCFPSLHKSCTVSLLFIATPNRLHISTILWHHPSKLLLLQTDAAAKAACGRNHASFPLAEDPDAFVALHTLPEPSGRLSATSARAAIRGTKHGAILHQGLWGIQMMAKQHVVIPRDATSR